MAEGEPGFGLTESGKALTSQVFLSRLNPAGTELGENGAVAQLGARLNGIQEVTGSIPVSSTENKEVVALAITSFFIES